MRRAPPTTTGDRLAGTSYHGAGSRGHWWPRPVKFLDAHQRTSPRSRRRPVPRSGTRRSGATGSEVTGRGGETVWNVVLISGGGAAVGAAAYMSRSASIVDPHRCMTRP